MGIVGIWFGIVGDQCSRFIFSEIRFRQGKWTKIKIYAGNIDRVSLIYRKAKDIGK